MKSQRPNSPHVILESTQMLVQDTTKFPPGVPEIPDGLDGETFWKHHASGHAGTEAYKVNELR